MSNLTGIKSAINSLFVNNTDGNIEATDVRAILIDMCDVIPNRVYNATFQLTADARLYIGVDLELSYDAASRSLRYNSFEGILMNFYIRNTRGTSTNASTFTSDTDGVKWMTPSGAADTNYRLESTDNNNYVDFSIKTENGECLRGIIQLIDNTADCVIEKIR
jgi:hypothetical protein